MINVYIGCIYCLNDLFTTKHSTTVHSIFEIVLKGAQPVITNLERYVFDTDSESPPLDIESPAHKGYDGSEKADSLACQKMITWTLPKCYFQSQKY